MKAKMFPMHAIMTVKTGICMGKFGVAHELIEWLVGHPVWTHQIPECFDAVQTRLTELFPFLPAEADSENWQQVLEDTITSYGDGLQVPQWRGETT